ncbi:MAG: RecX family transcriptional regulator [Microbacterium sp.]|nr:MAG: RecX family transcriptional regulator [Microbacterium sp.]
MRFVDGGEPEHLAPVVPLFPGVAVPAVPEQAMDAAAADSADPRCLPSVATASGESVGLTRDGAEGVLLKRLRTRQLSVREARDMFAEREVDPETAEAILTDFEDRGYLDDARLAEQLVHGALTRKAQGRRAIAQSLSTRGIPREVVDAALDELPDDEAERALEFARQKARSMGSLDRDAALRRLHGQLARRGFGGPVAMGAARQALDEASAGTAGPRFR